MDMLIMSVIFLITKYGDNPVEHKFSTLQCLFPPCLTDINHQLTNVFTLREEFVLVFQEYGSRTQAYSLAFNRRGKNCGLYKVTLKRSLNGLCSHSATCLCSRQTLRVRHACICKFVFVYAALGQIQALTRRTWQHLLEKIFALQNLNF